MDPKNAYPEAHVYVIHAVISKLNELLLYDAPVPEHVYYNEVEATTEFVFATI